MKDQKLTIRMLKVDSLYAENEIFKLSETYQVNKNLLDVLCRANLTSNLSYDSMKQTAVGYMQKVTVYQSR